MRMYSDSSRDSVRSLLSEAASHYQRAAEETADPREARQFRERAALLEELVSHVRQPGVTPGNRAAASPSVLPGGPPRPEL
jgi:hypothetical protein